MLQIKDRTVVENELATILLFYEHHTCGKILFLDKNDTPIAKLDALETSEIKTSVYHEQVKFTKLKEYDNSYPDETVATIKFLNLEKEEIKRK